MSLDRADIDRLIEALNARGDTASVSSGNKKDYDPKGFDTLLERAKIASKNVEFLGNTLRLTASKQREYREAQYQQIATLRQLEDQLKELDRKIAQTGDETLKAKRKEVQGLIRSAAIQENSTAAFTGLNTIVQRAAGFIRQFGTQLISAQTSIVSTIQSGGSGFAIAGEIANQQAQIQNTVNQGVAHAMTMAGAAAMSFGNIYVKAAGLALGVFAQKLSVTSDLTTQLELARTRVIVTEGDKLLNSYKTATSAGALLTGGANTMVNSLAGTGLVLEDYANAAKRNAQQLAQSGLGIGEASLLFGDVSKRLKASGLQKGLMALGLGIETQLDIMAQSAANLTAAAPNLAKSLTREQLADRIAQHTERYGVQLAKLNSLTGESVEALAKKKAAEEDEAAFQNFIRDLGDKAGPEVLNAFRQMPKDLQRVAFETAQFGQPVSDVTARLSALDPVAYGLGANLGNMAKAGTLTIDTMIAEAAAKKQALLDEQNRNRELNKTLYLAKNSATETVNSASAITRWSTMIGTNADKVGQNIQDQLDASKAPVDAANSLTRQFISMEMAGRDLRDRLQQMVIPKLGEFAGHLKDAGDYIQALLDRNVKMPKVKDPIEELTASLNEWANHWFTNTMSLVTKFLHFFEGGMRKIFAKFGIDTPTEPVKPGEAKNGKTNKPGAVVDEKVEVSRLNPAQKAEFDKLRAQGVPPAEALQKVRTPGQNLRAAENRAIESRATPSPSAPPTVPEAPPAVEKPWYEKIYDRAAGAVNTGKNFVMGSLEAGSKYVDDAFRAAGKALTDIPYLGKVFSFGGETIKWLGKELGKLAGPLTIFFSGLEAWNDYLSFGKGDISAGELTKRLVGNITSTVAAWFAASAATTAVAASGIGTGGVTSLLAPAAGVATFYGTEKGVRYGSDAIFDFFGIGDKGIKLNAMPPRDDRAPGASSVGPQSAVDPRKSVIEQQQLAQAAAIERDKAIKDLIVLANNGKATKEQLDQLRQLNVSIAQVKDVLETANADRSQGVRYQRIMAVNAG